MLGHTTARLVVAVCALCGCNTAREEKQEKQQRGGGGALVLWYRGGSSFGIGQRLQLQWFYCHTNWVSILVTHVCCLVFPSPHSALPCLLCLLVAATLFWLCLLFAFVCVLQDSCAYLDAQKTHWLHGPDTLIKRTSCTEPQTAELHPAADTLHPAHCALRPLRVWRRFTWCCCCWCRVQCNHRNSMSNCNALPWKYIIKI